MVVDDHDLIRKGLIMLLESYPDITIVGEAGDGESGILVAIRENPDVILMDISMPKGLDGFTATQEILKQVAGIKIILLTMHDEEIYIQKAVEINAHGYILKRSKGSELYEAILAVHRGERYYRVGLPEEQITKLFLGKKKDHGSILTSREQEMVRFIILGYTNKQISEKLLISPKTVENHKANIMKKLNLKNKSDLIQYGLHNDYLNLA